jgi:hypothetical protein
VADGAALGDLDEVEADGVAVPDGGSEASADPRGFDDASGDGSCEPHAATTMTIEAIAASARGRRAAPGP